MPLAVELLGTVPGRVMDLGCGEGQVMRSLDTEAVFGCDISFELLEHASDGGPVVRCRLPDLGWVRDGAVAALTCVLVLEHLDDIEALFDEVARVLAPCGAFVVVMNHPAYTPDGAGPVVDISDGEVLWRWGAYFERGAGTEPAGRSSVVFHHRPLGIILNVAANRGLRLEQFEERPMSPEAVSRAPGLAGQEHFPRLLGLRWRVPEAP